ncbi:MAG: hemolysin family protein [Acidimicrobiales bacterium]
MTATVRFSGTDGLILGAVVVLLAGSAVLALAETGLTRTSRAKAKSLADSHHRGVKALQRLVDDPESFLAPVLLLVLLCQLVAATLVGVVAAHLFGPWGVAAATVFEVVVIFVLGEAVPKQWAVRHADQAALLAAPIVSAVVGFPPVRWFSKLLIGIARAITPGGRSAKSSSDVTESELLAFADVALEDEAIETDERALIHQIIEFGDTIVREVMVPRPDVVAVDADTAVEEVLERAIKAGYSRIPSYRETVDDIVGIAFTKDLVRAVRDGRQHLPVGEVARLAHYVPETKRVAPLLREMQRGQFHIAVVIDEYGGTAGVVTLEDLIEELVGEIVDEFDTIEPLIEPLDNGAFRISGKMPVAEVNELLSAGLPIDDDWDTIGGLVMAKAGRVPVVGETLTIGPYLLTVDRIVGRRIGAVRVERSAGDERPVLSDSASPAEAPVTKLP